MSGVNFPPPGSYFPNQPQNDPLQNFMKAAQDFANNPTQHTAHVLLAYMSYDSSAVCGNDAKCSTEYTMARSAVSQFESFPHDSKHAVEMINSLLTYLEQ